MNKNKSYKGLGIFSLIVAIIMIVSYVSAGLIISNSNVNLSSLFTNFTGFHVENINSEFVYNDEDNNNLSDTIVQPMNNVEKINIESFSPNVEIHTTDDNDIKAVLKTNLSNLKLEKTISNNELFIKVKIKNKLIYNLGSSKVDVTIPKKFKKNLVIKTISGDIDISSANLETVNISTTSGNISSEKVSANTLSIQSTSSDINIDDCTADTQNISTVSGNITSSGKYKKNSLKSTSGNVNLTLTESFDSVNATCISGDINITVPNNSSANLNLNTMSGDIKNNINVTNETSSERSYTAKSADGSTRSITCSSTSGDIEIN